MTISLIRGDCLEVMAGMEAQSVDAVICDSPYGLNTKSSYNGKQGKVNPWGDMCNSAFWYSAWMSECKRLLKPTGAMWCFLNWRSMVTFQKASCDIEWPIDSLLIWDKEWIGPGGSRGLRPSYEMVALFGMERFALKNRGLSDIWRCKWSSIKPHGHPAEKPVDLIRKLIIEMPEANTILDCFMGSGTTGEACHLEGRNFIGIEQDPQWFKVAERRIHDAQMQPSLI